MTRMLRRSRKRTEVLRSCSPNNLQSLIQPHLLKVLVLPHLMGSQMQHKALRVCVMRGSEENSSNVRGNIYYKGTFTALVYMIWVVQQ